MRYNFNLSSILRLYAPCPILQISDRYIDSSRPRATSYPIDQSHSTAILISMVILSLTFYGSKCVYISRFTMVHISPLISFSVKYRSNVK